jgi:hypothetical protein
LNSEDLAASQFMRKVTEIPHRKAECNPSGESRERIRDAGTVYNFDTIVVDGKPEVVVMSLKRLVGERGFEPPTPWSRTRCSTRLSHSPTLSRTQEEIQRVPKRDLLGKL